jgi:hypothetical protein
MVLFSPGSSAAISRQMFAAPYSPHQKIRTPQPVVPDSCDFFRLLSLRVGYFRQRKSQTKRPPGNRVTSSFSRENSSNGALNSVKTFWNESYEPKKGVSSNFWEINAFVFNDLNNKVIGSYNVSN